ncbi:hypothetical protein B7494_g4613 [Chlorociboria aeruginascens]|nr:hypothetical protein B7494_g4613 [Chlorociboria aeruginascens]
MAVSRDGRELQSDTRSSFPYRPAPTLAITDPLVCISYLHLRKSGAILRLKRFISSIPGLSGSVSTSRKTTSRRDAVQEKSVACKQLTNNGSSVKPQFRFGDKDNPPLSRNTNGLGCDTPGFATAEMMDRDSSKGPSSIKTMRQLPQMFPRGEAQKLKTPDGTMAPMISIRAEETLKTTKKVLRQYLRGLSGKKAEEEKEINQYWRDFKMLYRRVNYNDNLFLNSDDDETDDEDDLFDKGTNKSADRDSGYSSDGTNATSTEDTDNATH